MIIGPAGRLLNKLTLALKKQDRVKLLLYGPPGVGKTTLADHIAAAIGGKWDVESVNGRHATIHLVREWQANMQSSSLFGGWKVKIVNEVDTMPKDAQDALLTMLDEMPAQRAFIGTSNLDLDLLTERFRTRLRRAKVEAPTIQEIEEFLLSKSIPGPVAKHIAATSCGNVRAAMIDAEAWANEQEESPAAEYQDLLASL